MSRKEGAIASVAKSAEELEENAAHKIEKTVCIIKIKVSNFD